MTKYLFCLPLLIAIFSIFVSPTYAGDLTTPFSGSKNVNQWFDHDPGAWPDPSLKVLRYDDVDTGGNDGHTGIDFGLSPGTSVYAAAKGVIRETTYDNCGGYYVRIWHSSLNKSTYYAHLQSNFQVSVGDQVRRGKLIAYSDDSGLHPTCITGAHLHFGVYKSDGFSNPIDPYGWTGGHTASEPDIYNRELWLFGVESGTVYRKYFDGEKFYSAWGSSVGKPSGINLRYQPDAKVFSDKKIYVFANGSDNKIWIRRVAYGASWGSWFSIPGSTSINGSPKTAILGSEFFVFAKGNDNNAYYSKSTNGVDWDNWASLGTGVASDPIPVAGFLGKLYVATTLSSNDHVAYKTYNGSSWDSSWHDIGGPGDTGEVLSWDSGASTDNVEIEYSGDTDDIYIAAQSGDGGASSTDDRWLYVNTSSDGSNWSGWNQGLMGSNKVSYAPQARAISLADSMWVLARSLEPDGSGDYNHLAQRCDTSNNSSCQWRSYVNLGGNMAADGFELEKYTDPYFSNRAELWAVSRGGISNRYWYKRFNKNGSGSWEGSWTDTDDSQTFDYPPVAEEW